MNKLFPSATLLLNSLKLTGLGFLFFFNLLPVIAQKQTHAQLGDLYYDRGEYLNALRHYKRVKNANSIELLERMAYCYYLNQQYDSAVVNFKRVIDRTSSTSSESRLKYIKALKRSGRLKEALIQLELLNQKKTNSLLTAHYSFLKKHIVDTGISNQGLVFPPILNTQYSEIPSFWYKGKLFFSSNRYNDFIANKRNKNTGSYPYQMWSVNINVKNNEVTFNQWFKSFPFSINAFDNTGALVYNKTREEIIFTRTPENDVLNKNPKNRPQLFVAKVSGDIEKLTFFDVRPLAELNNTNYSVLHPTVSPDGNYLVFASDMAGGQGKLDLYISKWESTRWGVPQNLGASINTPENEAFPFFRKDGVLFFASEGLPGFGGLDLYRVKLNGLKAGWPFNLGWGLNSTADDFSLCFDPDSLGRGVFASNRTGTKGKDDIIFFNTTEKFTDMDGRLVYSSGLANGLANKKVVLLTSDGVLLEETFTDVNGYFKFSELPADEKYLLRLGEEDLQKNFDNQTILMLNADGKVVAKKMLKGHNQSFVFEDLPADLTMLKPLEGEEDNSYLFTTGYLNVKDKNGNVKGLSGKKVYLVADNGDTLEVVVTKEFGSFVFKVLKSDENAIVLADLSDPELNFSKVFISSKEGKELAGGKVENGKVAFNLKTAALKANDTLLRKNISGFLAVDNSEHFTQGVPIIIKNKQGVIVRKVVSDKEGYFEFTNLSADSIYLVSLDDADPGLKAYKKVYVFDRARKPVFVFDPGTNQKFRFDFLPADAEKLTEYAIEDPWLNLLHKKSKESSQKVEIIIENIYYEYNSAELTEGAKNILAKVSEVLRNNPGLKLEIESHTDTRASEAFNLLLSQKRAENVKRYLVQQGVALTRLGAKGMGESKPLNRCLQGVECSEEEHAKNRRTEFYVTR